MTNRRYGAWRAWGGWWLAMLVYAGVGLAACNKAKFDKVVIMDGGPGSRDVASQPSDARDAPVAMGSCAPGTVSRAKGKAQACTCDDECQTGFCSDGICCTSACGEACKSCNLRSSLGDCAFVPAGGKPSDSLDCVASTPATCGQDGTCDGKGGCRLYVQGSECKPGQCDGDRVADILTCDGNGKCSQSLSRTCPPYACDPATNRCATACATSAMCAAGQECVAGRCGKSANGASCESASDCSSGFCVDSVCCNIACSGPCVACAQTGSVGRCTFLAAGMTEPACEADEPTTCGHTGLCDGSGSCTIYPENTVCGPSSCSGLRQNTPRTCDGQGTCRDSQLVDCAPFLCGAGACQTSCDPSQGDTCEPGHLCVAQTKDGVTSGICGQRKNGQPCSDNGDCESDACVDGVCCEGDCAGPCRSCNLAGSPGRCLDVGSGAPDPRNTCRDLGASACATNGRCDGKGACQSYPPDTVCGSQSCVAGAYNPPSTCNATGQCVASRSRTCSPFACNGDTCHTACGTGADCAPGEFCTNGSCGLKPRGAECAAAKECASGFCAQGVCCDGACTGACLACNLTASAGTCTAVADHAPDPQGKCAVTNPTSCGTTGTCLKGACAYVEQGQNCASAACATSSSVTPASTCNGLGACLTPANHSCGAFTCAAGACKAGCTLATEAADCVPPNTCVNNSCGLKLTGAACTNASQCSSGFCVEGVCCNSLCANATVGGLCKTCKGTPTSPPGTCANVASGGADPLSRCLRSAAANGDCSSDGTCDGAGACRPWSSSTGCRQESCVGSAHTQPATCDGAGACPAAITSSCGAYVCSGTSPTCLNTCASDANCTGGLTCLKTNNRCGDKLAAGESCVANGDCGTGLVCSAEGVCCDKTCAGGCQSCRLSGKAGVCSSIASGSPARSTSPPTCSPAPAGACGASGNCDGAGGCAQRASCTPSITVCPSDPHQQYTASGLCSASGVCGPQTTACNLGYLCVAGGACATSCTLANASTHCDVAQGYGCIGGFCQKKSNGTACTTGVECGSGNCVDGVCCSSASCADCKSCNIAGKAGSCQNVPANGADGACVGTCPSRTQAAGLCDGAGSCKPAASCATGFTCVAGLCENSCTRDADCAPGYACAPNGSCKKANGQSCGGQGQCASGNCVDGTCCGSAVCSDCASCNVTGHEGVCYPVPAGANDGACVASCVGAQLSAACDGNGVCRPPAACPGGYLCDNNTLCALSCTTSCAAGYACSGGSCVPLKADGQVCATGGECLSGRCVDGVCCASASCAECLSCNVSGHAGVCYPVLAGVADGACVAVCPASGNLTSGLCDGSGACRAASACPGGQLCGANNQCSTDCTVTGCSAGFYCSGSTCLALKADGSTCAADRECAHGHCISNGSASICCSTGCTEVSCGTRALCNVGGIGCQSYAEGSACTVGAAACSADGRASLSSTGACSAGVCQPTLAPCLTGYLCVGGTCVGPGGCTAGSGCDAANLYACNANNGNCEIPPLDPIDAGK